jgi:transglutaminase-like putative cysteine protease
MRGRGFLPAVSQTTRSLVRQDIVAEPNVGRRFAIQPTQTIEDATAPFGSGQGGYERSQQQRYALATPAIANERQVKAIPNPNRRRSEEEEAAFREELIITTRFPADRFPRLAQIAAEALAQNQLTDGRPFDKAVALWRHFLAPGEYEYSLNLNISPDENIDPIEDFVANCRSGSCEYFASALAMMLRSQDIPARLVRGYKTGTFNTVGRYYLIQERDAHSWVEAWMPTDVVATELAGAPSDGGAWYRFDPTPARSNQLLLQEPGTGERIAQAFDYVELLWRDYVLSLNTARQDEIVYEPLTARAGALPQWVEMRRVRRWLQQAGTAMGFDVMPRGGRASRVFETSTAVAVIASLLVLAAFLYGLRLAWSAMFKRRGVRRKIANAAPEFYDRLERVLAKLLVVRKLSETPRELAAAAGQRLAAILGDAEIATLPAELVGVYYRVRFGKGRLDKIESDAIEQALKKIELAVHRTR